MIERIRNPQLETQALENLKASYEQRDNGKIHLTDLIYCLTRSYYDKTQPMPPTPEELMLFSLGFGLQRILVPKEQEAQEIECDGITLSPDFISVGGELAELKTTRMSTRQRTQDGQWEDKDFPETWVEQMMGYCYANQQCNVMAGLQPPDQLEDMEYDLLVLHMLGNYAPPFPQLIGWRLKFTQQELEDFWQYIQYRKLVLEEALRDQKPPTPYSWNRDWECKSCRYKMQCDIVSQAVQALHEEEDNE